MLSQFDGYLSFVINVFLLFENFRSLEGIFWIGILAEKDHIFGVQHLTLIVLEFGRKKVPSAQ